MNNSQILTVGLKDRCYTIEIGQDLELSLTSLINQFPPSQKIAFITDENVKASLPKWASAFLEKNPTLILPAGEKTKSVESLSRAYDFLAENKLDRSSVLFALGGGVIGDLAGFAAASYLRGIDFYQIPTTLLSMVDSSVGGKTGINISAGKNLVGAFHQPQKVFINVDFLKSLPITEFSAGMAEVIKHGMLYDIAFFEKLESIDQLHPNNETMVNVIQRNCEIKSTIVQLDEKEELPSGGRALLNLGHTFGHAIEQVTDYGEYLHGEAVSIGLLLAARLSQQLGLITQNDTYRVEALLIKYSLPIKLKKSLSINDLIEAMFRDKKAKQNKIKFVVMEKLGTAITTTDVNQNLIRPLWETVGAN